MSEAAAGKAVPSVQERLAEQMEAIVNKKIANDQLVLPSLPAVVGKCLNLLKSSDFSLTTASKLVESDPMLTAQLIKLSNSAAFGGREPIKSVHNAVTRLGQHKLRTFLVEASARKVFESTDPRISSACAGLWQHSVAVAILARDVTTLSFGGDPELGYLGGLLHDIGKPVVAAMLLEAERAVLAGQKRASWITGDDWVGVVQKSHRKVGAALAEKWGLPDVVVRTIAAGEDYDNSDRLSPANIVRFGNALAKQLGIYVGDVSKDDIDALVMIGKSLLNLDDEAIKKVTSGLHRAVKDQMT